MIDAEPSAVASYFSGKTVLVTGFTGFLGKVLVEKLIRSCPGIRRVYVLIRTKKGQVAAQRLAQLLDSQAFELIRNSRPSDLDKIQAVSGDLLADGLGLQPADEQLLKAEVNVVFHSAATVRFDEPLRLAVQMNVLGTQKMLQLAHGLTQLEAFVHVSTAYCNSHLKEISEEVLPAERDIARLIRLLEVADEDLLEAISRRVVAPRPNTYTFTKALAENLVQAAQGKLPVAIVRPSIVTGAWREPLPGWVDNINGPTGFIVGFGKGVLHTMLCSGTGIVDLIPVDVAVNLLVCAAHRLATTRPQVADVYFCTSGSARPLRWDKLEQSVRGAARKYPMNDVLWYPSGTARRSKWAHALSHAVLELGPAYAMDAVARLFGKQPMMVKVYRKMDKALRSMSFFITREWRFENKNSQRLFATLPPADKKLFNFDMSDIDWDEYLETYTIGTRKFVLKENMSTIPSAKKRLRKMYIIHVTMQCFMAYLTWRMVTLLFPTAKSLPYSLLSLLVQQYLNVTHKVGQLV